MNYDKLDSNIPKSIDQYEGNIDSATPFSALSNVINQSNHVEDSLDSKKLLITNNKILNVISKIQQDMYDEQDTSIKKIDKRVEKEQSETVQDIITNMFIENGDTDFNFISRRRFIPSRDTEEKKKKKEEEKKKEEAQKKRNKDQDKLNTQNEKRHKQNIKRHKKSSRGLGALFALDGALAIGEGIIGTSGPLGVAAAMAGVIAAAAAANVYVGYDAEIDEAGGDSANMSWIGKLSFALGNKKSKNDDILKQRLESVGATESNLFTKNTVKDWNFIGSLSIPELDILTKDRRYHQDDRAKFLFIRKLKSGKDYENSQETFKTFIENNVKNNGKGVNTSAPENLQQQIRESDHVKPLLLNRNGEIAMNYFVKQGWSEIQSAAIVGNLMEESRVDPRSVNMSKAEDVKGGGSWGIAQWNKTRKDAFLAEYPQYKTIKEIPLEIQLAYVHKELTSGVAANTGKKLKRMTNLDDATQLVLEEYEVPKDKIQPQRQENARTLFEDSERRKKIKATGGQTTGGQTTGGQATGGQATGGNKYILNNNFINNMHSQGKVEKVASKVNIATGKEKIEESIVDKLYSSISNIISNKSTTTNISIPQKDDNNDSLWNYFPR